LSLIRPRWLEDVLKLTPSSSTRLRGLKNFEPHHVPAFQDPLYADDPIFWILNGFLPGVALNTGKVGVQTPNDDNIVCTVDSIVIAAPVTDDYLVQVVLGGQILLALATDTGVTKMNRREQSRTTAIERAGLFRILDNANAFTGTNIADVHAILNTTFLLPLGFRLYGGEQLFVTNATVNQAIQVTMRGRVTTKGQR